MDKRYEAEKLLKEPFVIGAVRVNVAQKNTRRDYECAAWWEETESDIGTFAVMLRREYHSPHDLFVIASVGATVTNDYFPGLWGGVPISREPYKPKHLGEKRTVYINNDIVKAIHATGNSPDNDIDWFINPEFWSLALKEAENELVAAYESLPKWWAEYMQGEDEFNSRVSMIGHFGRIFVRRSKEIEEIKRQMKYLGMLPGNSPTKYWKDNYNNNTKWAKEFLGLPLL